jgi:hypothetical protein
MLKNCVIVGGLAASTAAYGADRPNILWLTSESLEV